VLLLAVLTQAQTFTTLYNFDGNFDGIHPLAGVIMDSAGNLYGTTVYGGYSDLGVVFEVNTAGLETVLQSFSGSDGEYPETPVAGDKAGNTYGTTPWGGSGSCTQGCGLVFKLDTAGNEKVLHSFTGGSDGCYPYQGLIVGKSGSLYGTTYGCVSVSSNNGTIFKIDSTGKFTVLHSFAGSPSDGAGPQLGHLTVDKAGNLYGSTFNGGNSGKGVLYELSKKGKVTVLHSFAGGTSDGCGPSGTVAQDKAGNFYGTTSACGSNNYGTIWKVSKRGREVTLHNFAGGTSDGCGPEAGVARDAKGNLYGLTWGCGANNDGVLFELSAKGTFTLLHNFDGSNDYPYGELLRSPNGSLYGTTYGYHDYGTVWEYLP